LKITIYLPWAYPVFHPEVSQTFGGAEVQLARLGRALAHSKEFEITFLCYAPRETSIERFDGFQIYRINEKERAPRLNFDPLGIRRFYGKKNRLLSILDEVDGDIFFQMCSSEETGWIARYCKEKGKKFIYFTAHDFDVDGEFTRKNRIAGYYYKYGLKNASLIIVQSHWQQQKLRETFNLDSVILKNPIEIPDEIPPLSERENILWVGRGDEIKHPETFIRLAEQIPQYKFTMIMPKSDNFPGLFDQIKAKASKIKNLEFIDFVPYNKIDTYYKKARIFVSTSDFEGFPNTFLEAGRFGTPVVSLNVDPDGFLEKYDCGVVCKGNKDVLFEFVEGLLKDKKKWERLGGNIRSYVEKFHDVDMISDQLGKYIHQLVK